MAVHPTGKRRGLLPAISPASCTVWKRREVLLGEKSVLDDDSAPPKSEDLYECANNKTEHFACALTLVLHSAEKINQ